MRKLIIIIFFFVAGQRLSAFAQKSPAIDTPISKGTIYVKKAVKDTTIKIWLKPDTKYKITVAPIKQEKDPNAYDWYERITIVKSFDSKADQAAAASANLIFPKDSASSINFAFAIGYNVLSPKAYGAGQLNPFFGWQKNTLMAKKQDVITSGLNYQMLLPKFSSGGTFQFYAISQVNYKNDRVKSTEGTQANIYLQPAFYGHGDKFYFLPDARMKNDAIEILYDLYGGLEYENTASAKNAGDKGSVYRLYGRILATLSPLPDLLDERLQFIPDYTIRSGFSKTITNEEKTNKLWKYSLNLVLIKQETSKFGDISIGYSHQKGVDPTAGFQNQSVGTFSLNVKVTPGAASK